MVLATPALAEDAAPAIAVELNALDPVEGACRLVFVTRNGMEADVASLILEAVAFDEGGGVARIALFDFGTLPADRTRVRQFDLAETPCSDVGAVLVNGVESCVGPNGCADALVVSSRAEGVEMMQ